MWLSFERAAVPGDRGDAHQTRGLFVVESTDFGHVRQQGHGGDYADGRNAHQDVEAWREGRIGSDDLMALRMDLFDLAGGVFAGVPELALEQGNGRGLAFVGDAGALFHQAAPRWDQFLELFERRSGQ